MSSLAHRWSQNPFHLDSALHRVFLVCFVMSCSYLAARLGDFLVIRPELVWPFWPGCAFLVAVLLLTRRRVWPELLAAGMTGFVLYDLQAGLTMRSIALLILADAIEVLIAVAGVRYAFGGIPHLDSVRSLAKYSLFAVVLAPVSVATIGASAFGGDYWLTWRTNFLTEAGAMLTLAPAILSWVGTGFAWAKQSKGYYLEAALLLSGLTALGYGTFVASGGSSLPASLYSLVPFLLWSALRFGIMGISTSMLVVSFLSILGAIHGRGPFTASTPLNNVLSLQLFLLFGRDSVHGSGRSG